MTNSICLSNSPANTNHLTITWTSLNLVYISALPALMHLAYVLSAAGLPPYWHHRLGRTVLWGLTPAGQGVWQHFRLLPSTHRSFSLVRNVSRCCQGCWSQGGTDPPESQEAKHHHTVYNQMIFSPCPLTRKGDTN